MGASQCCSGTIQSAEASSYFYEFGEDSQEPLTLHTDSIETNDDICKFFLFDCEKRLKLSSRLYKDPSISSQPMVLKESESRGSRQIRCVFNRPYYFLKTPRASKYAIFPSKVGNCDDICLQHDALQYFSMFLCFLADKPHLLNEIIVTYPNTYGIQVIAMYYKGVRKHVYIDDYILCNEDKPIFSQPVGGAMWPCLIEKAWLKVKGYSSHQILVTSPLQVFHHFLQYPSANYQLGQIEEEAYRKLKGILRGREQAMIAISRQEPKHKIGLSGRRSYYLKFLFTFQGRTLYYLRNPCGTFDFRGIHKSMPPELEAKLRSDGEQIAQGNFVLEQEQFLQQMEEIQVFFYNSNSSVVTQEVLRSKGGDEMFVQLNLPSHEEVSLNFVQQEEPYCPITYQVISKKDGRILSGFTNDDGCFGVRSTNLLDDTFQRLAPGSYLIRLKKKPNKLYQGVYETNDKLVVTGSSRIDIAYSMHEEYREQFYSYLFEYGARGMNRISQSHQRGRQIQHWSFWVGDLVVVCVWKLQHAKRPINLQVSFPQRVNLECITHSLNPQFTALPFDEHHLLIVFEKIDLTGQTVLGRYFIDTF